MENLHNIESNDKIKILCLDDEERIVKSLKSLFRFKYDVYTALDAKTALSILSKHTISVVISDQKMPEMTGAEFLKIAKDVSPHTVRLLLTGFSDLDAIVSSVNDSEIYRFLTKPWGNSQLTDIVAEAVEVSLAIQRSHTLTNTDLNLADSEFENKDDVFVLYKSIENKSFASIADLLPSGIKVLYANSTEETIKLLETYPINIMIATLNSSEADCELLKLLKRELPNLLTIGLVDFSDYEELIELINEARLYRYIVKPAKPVQLTAFIKSAILESRKLSANPELLKQHKVMHNIITPNEITPALELLSQPTLIGRLKALFKRK